MYTNKMRQGAGRPQKSSCRADRNERQRKDNKDCAHTSFDISQHLNIDHLRMVDITVEQGRLHGRLAFSEETGRCYFSFQGIPYAAPPIGHLRFKAPEPPIPWTGIRDATQLGNVCPQFHMVMRDYRGKEDCLVLNVYTPQFSNRNTALLPVMVRFHGGGFTTGSGNTELYGPDFLVAEDIVLVTVNYRLGVLGFLCVEEPFDGCGNAGLKDQVAALRWVQRNISRFGGDPHRVTIAGESAGGASVHYHMLSPMSRDLFQYAITESGCALHPWAFTDKARKHAFRLGDIMGHTSSDARELLSFLRSKPARELVEKATGIFTSEEKRSSAILRPFPFVPCLEVVGGVEEPFILSHPLTLLREGHYFHVPLMAGINSREGILLLASLLNNKERALQRIDKNLAVLLPENLTSNLVRSLDDSEENSILDEVRAFYFNGQHISESTMTEYMDLLGDVMFVLSFYQAIREHLQVNTAPIYLYQFSYDGRLNVFKNILSPNITGACHADELGYLFKMDMLTSASDLPDSAPERAVRARMVKMWTNFVKYGRPQNIVDNLTPVIWLPATSERMTYLNIGETLKIEAGIAHERMSFWEGMYKRHCNVEPHGVTT